MPLTAESERFIKGATYGTGPDHFRMDGNVEWLRAQLAAIEDAAALAATPDAVSLTEAYEMGRSDTDALRARVEELTSWLRDLTDGGPWAEDFTCIGCGKRQSRIEHGGGHPGSCAYVAAKAYLAAPPPARPLHSDPDMQARCDGECARDECVCRAASAP